MKQKELEMKLQKIPEFENPKPGLEQYITPAPIAADILFKAFQQGDIKDKIVVDLGCGTGIFAYGAYLLEAQKVVGVDIDKECIDKARSFVFENDLCINYVINEIKNINIVCDTVLMNPPFGAQKTNIRADRRFIEKAFEISQVFYSLHLSNTMDFVKKIISALNGNITHTKEYDFPIKHAFSFHKKPVKKYKISMIRVKKQ
jgi:putative methylase